MQQSNALRKIDEDSLVPLSEEDNEPKFGDRSYYKKKKTFEQLSAPKVDNPYANSIKVIKKVTEDRIVHLENKVKFEEDISEETLKSIELHHFEKKDPLPLVKTIMRDVLANCITYSLILIICVLCVYKVILVQETREVTIMYNEAVRKNELMHKEWLALLSEREILTEYSNIRQSASNNLGMIQPKTENEIVIDLR
jgi:cell division protein FtsL